MSLRLGKAASFAVRSRNFLGSFNAKENKQKGKPRVAICWFYEIIYLALKIHYARKGRFLSAFH